MFRNGLILLSLLITVISFALLIFYYDQLPEEIPVFVDLKGKPTSFLYKSPIAVFRLPIMGVMLQGVCLTMYFVNTPSSLDKHQQLWLSASLLGAFKMTLTSIEIILYKDLIFLNSIRVAILSIILAAVISILLNLYELYKTYRENFSLYSSGVTGLHKILLLFFLSGYLFCVLIPFFA